MAQTRYATAARIFEIEQKDDTLIVVPAVDLRELDYLRIEEGASGVLDLLNGHGIKNFVIDFARQTITGPQPSASS